MWTNRKMRHKYMWIDIKNLNITDYTVQTQNNKTNMKIGNNVEIRLVVKKRSSLLSI